MAWTNWTSVVRGSPIDNGVWHELHANLYYVWDIYYQEDTGIGFSGITWPTGGSVITSAYLTGTARQQIDNLWSKRNYCNSQDSADYYGNNASNHTTAWGSNNTSHLSPNDASDWDAVCSNDSSSDCPGHNYYNK